MTTELLNQHRVIWDQKPVLRAIYHDYYQRILSYTVPGRTLEIGGGTGNLKHYLPDVISTDILSMPWLDISCDAQCLPFADETFDNIVAMDVLHHIERPIRFLTEAKRVLKKGGKIILLEPAITKVSWFFYQFFHPEPVILNVDPLLDGALDVNRKAFDANQAIPELLFGKFYPKFSEYFPEFILKTKEYLSFFAYPLSGGFRKWSLIPKIWINQLLNFEKRIESYVGKHMGFRILITIAKENNE